MWHEAQSVLDGWVNVNVAPVVWHVVQSVRAGCGCVVELTLATPATVTVAVEAPATRGAV